MTMMDPREEWDLERELVHLEKEMNRLSRQTPRVFPSIIISTSDNSLVVRAEVPGMKLEDFEISVSGDTLTILAEFSQDHGYGRARSAGQVSIGRGPG